MSKAKAPAATTPTIVDKSLLITSSILDAYDWYKSAPPSTKKGTSITWQESAATDFRNALFKTPYEIDPAAKRGIDFEARICRDLYMQRSTFLARHGDLLTTEFYDKCAGGLQQEVVKYVYKIDGQLYCLYGKKDISFPVGSAKHPKGKTIDIKTTKEWKGHSKYTGRSQHPLYIAAGGIEEFEYLVAVGEDREIAPACVSETGVRTAAKVEWTVDSVIPVVATLSRDDAFAIIESKIRAFVAFLSTEPELEKAYRTIFTK